MKWRGSLTSMCALLMLFGGCPKREQPGGIVVYVPALAPAPAPAAAAATPPTQQYMVLEEPPPPPEPQGNAAPQTTGQTPPAHRTGRKPHAETPTETDETATPETPEPPPEVILPALEPRQSSAQENELRRQFQAIEQDFQNRLAHLNAAKLSANDQRTLEDARTFFAQATEAMNSGDLPRALNLAHKAELLLAALQ